MDTQLRKNIRERWLWALFGFTDVTYQRRLWLGGFYPDTIGSYTEALCTYFDDLNLNEGYDSFVNQGFATKAEAAIVIPFHEALDKYTNNTAKKDFDNKEVLGDPDWHELVRLGFATWQQLKAHLNSTQEYEFIQQLEDKYL